MSGVKKARSEINTVHFSSGKGRLDGRIKKTKQWFESHKGNGLIIVISIVYLIILLVTAMLGPSKTPHPPVTAIQNISIFAIFYLIAQLSERITELFSNIFWSGNAENVDKYETQIDILKNAINKNIEKRAQDPSFLDLDFLDTWPIQETIEKVKDLNKKIDYDSRERAIGLWALASFIGVVFTSQTAGLFEIIGVNLLPHTWDSFFSGIIIGGGTKPLHDLISYIEKKP